MKKLLIVLGVLLVLGLMFAGWYISGINRLVAIHENVEASWSQVENQLQRRNDLVPNLVNTVKGYAAHEEGIFTEVTKLRSQWGAAATTQQKIDTANQLTGAISRLLLVAENYPDLKANQNFLTLQTQLEGTENRIAVERMRYNRAVRGFNTYIRTVFGNFFAARRGLNSPAVYFEAEETARQVPEVKF